VSRTKKAILGLIGIAIGLASWQLATQLKLVNSTAIPSMTTSFSTLAHNLKSGSLWSAVGETLKGMTIGLVVGLIAGIIVGTIIGLNNFIYDSFFLLVEFGRVVPIIALVPLAVLFYGSTLKMAVVVVTYAVFFPMVVQTIYGVRAVEPVVRDTAKMFNFRRREKFFSVVLPSAAPYLATGLRISTAVALLVDVLAELTGGGGGLGTGILEGEASGVISYTYALIIVTGVIGLVLYLIVSTFEKRVLRWHAMYRSEQQW
jgi:ABC-type nitrate/sulfonate/bicarbonate transport system permease component